MTKEEFVKLDENGMIKSLLENVDTQEELLNYLKSKNKSSFFKISGKLKSAKLNSKSIKTKETEVQNVVELELSKIKPNPFQPRLDFKDTTIQEIAESIKEYGLLQPITVNKTSDDKYEIIAGETRFRAHEYLKKEKIKAIINSQLKANTDEYNKSMISKALIENVNRKNLDPLELSISYKNALDNKVFKNATELAKTLGKQQIHVTKVLSVLKLSDFVTTHIKENKKVNDIDTLYYLQKIDDEEKQKEFYLKLFEGQITRIDIITYIKNLKDSKIKADSKDIFVSKITKNKLAVQGDFKNFDKKREEEFNKELNELISKYL